MRQNIHILYRVTISTGHFKIKKNNFNSFQWSERNYTLERLSCISILKKIQISNKQLAVRNHLKRSLDFHLNDAKIVELSVNYNFVFAKKGISTNYKFNTTLVKGMLPPIWSVITLKVGYSLTVAYE